MKKLIYLLLLILFPFSTWAQTMSSAEKAFQDGDFTTARAEYQKLLPNANGQSGWKIQLRLAACEYHLGAYLNAAKQMYDYPLPQAKIWQARFLLYRIQMANQASSVYRPLLNVTPIDSASAAADKSQWTREQWQRQIDEDFRRLWALQDTLKEAPITQESLILDLKDTDVRRIPTLFDFVVHDWLAYLGRNSALAVAPLNATSPSYLEGTARIKEGPAKATTQLRSQILAAAAVPGGTERENAVLFWQTDAILQPFSSADFVIENKEKATRQVIDRLQPLWQGTSKPAGKKKKSVFPNPSQTVYGRSYVAAELAQFLYTNQRYAQALEVCQQARKLTPSYFTQQCADLAEQITRVELSIQDGGFPVNRLVPQISFQGKNLTRVYARVYATSYEDWSKRPHSWRLTDHFRLDKEDILSFAARKPLLTQTVKVPNKEVGSTQEGRVELTSLEKGFYVVLLSPEETFNAATTAISGTVLNATDLAVFASAAVAGNPADYVPSRTAAPRSLDPAVFHLYTLNLQTGIPEPATELQLITDYRKNTHTTARSSSDGVVDLPRKVVVSPHRQDRNESYTLDVLAQKDGSTAFLNNSLYFHFNNEPVVQIFAQTDRPIYRPGQRVQLAAQAFENLPRGLKTLSDTTVRFQITDPNGKTIYSAQAPFNALGSAQTEMTLPQANLLGTYAVSACVKISQQDSCAYQDFNVEEYSRPEYELTLEDASLVYDQKTEVVGNARYYMGTPLEGAEITYTLKRQNYRPLFYWWIPRPVGGEKILLQGKTMTDKNGKFTIPIIPVKQAEDEEFAQYILQAHVQDASGRSISADRSYRISAHPYLFRVTFTQGFYEAGKKADLAEVDLTDSGGKSIPGTMTVRAVRLENRMPQSQESPFSSQADKPSLESWYKDFKAVETAFTRTLTFRKPGPQVLTLPALPEGVYRLEVSGEKATPQQLIFIVAAEKSALQLPDVAIAKQSTYYPGEMLQVLLGAGNLQGSKWVEIYQKDQFLTHRALLGGGAEIFTWPLTQAQSGGVALRWFGASNYRFHTAQTSVKIPFLDKQLRTDLQTPQAVKPGENVRWKLTVKDSSGSAVNGLVNVTVYDKSLDYYRENHLPFTFEQLYPQRTAAARITDSRWLPPVRTYRPLQEDTQVSRQRALELPVLNLQFRGMLYAVKGLARGAVASPMMRKETMADNVTFMAGNSMREGFDSVSAPEEAAEEEPFEEKIPVRTDFSETAYFNPALPLQTGKASLHFTLPQALTTWKVQGFALTYQGDWGTFETSVFTRKELMVRLQMPRFYREQDQSILQAAVTNQTGKAVKARVTLAVKKGDASVLDQWGITQAQQTVSVPANSTRFVSWKITAPADPALYQVTAVARTAADSDAEQRTVPVLPGKMRLLASSSVALQNGNNLLSLAELDSVPVTDIDTVALRLDPSLALSVLESLPGLLVTPYNDLVTTLNRYAPLAIVHQFYTTYPSLQQAVKKLPKRTGRTAPWNDQDPLRLQLLEQTPWLRQSQGNADKQAEILSLFDDKQVNTYLQKELARISRLQKPSGAFTWFPGGPDDDYLTLYALNTFAQVKSYGAALPEASVQKAITYLVPRVEERLKKDTSGSAATVAHALYAAYTLSAFPADWEQTRQATAYIKRWVAYADKHLKFMTPLGLTYAAAVYHRLGDKTAAERYLNLLLSRLKEDPLTGAYFAPEAQSWIWYNDTLTTQTAALRTLLEMRPQARQVDTLTQWLLFNRQTNEWNNSNAAAQTLFTLLKVMQTRGALETASSYQVDWGGQTKIHTFDPLEWTTPLQWVRTGSQIAPNALSARIQKQSKQTDFASLTAIYRGSRVAASPKGVLNVDRRYYLRRVREDGQSQLVPLEDVATLRPGDEVEVHLTLTSDSAFEYVFLQDPKPAGFESTDLLSGWAYDTLSFYREVKDASTQFFLPFVPRGQVTLRYVLRPTVTGRMQALPAQVQSMYAPQYGAHSAGTSMSVEK